MTSLKFKEVTCYLYTSLVLLSGVVLIGFALYLGLKLVSHFKFVPNEALGPFFLIFLAGIAHILITWFGKKGPSSEHDFFIITFVILCIILLFFEFFVGVWSMILRSEVRNKSTKLLEESQANYFQLNYDHKDWDNLETKLGCCGLNGTGDYFATGKYPVSCFKCDAEETDDKKNLCMSLKAQQSGCKEPLIDYVEMLLLQISLVGFLSGLFQVLGIACYIIYFKGLKKERAIRAANRASRLRQSLSANTGYVNRRTSNERNMGPSAPT